MSTPPKRDSGTIQSPDPTPANPMQYAPQPLDALADAAGQHSDAHLRETSPFRDADSWMGVVSGQEHLPPTGALSVERQMRAARTDARQAASPTLPPDLMGVAPTEPQLHMADPSQSPLALTEGASIGNEQSDHERIGPPTAEILDRSPPSIGADCLILAPASPEPDFAELSLSTCKNCGQKFTPRFQYGRPQLHCSDECRLAFRRSTGGEARAAWKWRNSESGRESRRERKRRKKTPGGQQVREPSFDRLLIFARDDWRCQLCGDKVQDARPEARDSATIRLIVPTQLGGKYSLSNCETACRQCNGRGASLIARFLGDRNFRLPRSLRSDVSFEIAAEQRASHAVESPDLLDRSLPPCEENIPD